jgi:hypothetical protein
MLYEPFEILVLPVVISSYAVQEGIGVPHSPPTCVSPILLNNTVNLPPSKGIPISSYIIFRKYVQSKLVPGKIPASFQSIDARMIGIVPACSEEIQPRLQLVLR